MARAASPLLLIFLSAMLSCGNPSNPLKPAPPAPPAVFAGPMIYERTCEIRSVTAKESACANADWSVWSVWIPGQQPIGKKYRVTIQELR